VREWWQAIFAGVPNKSAAYMSPLSVGMRSQSEAERAEAVRAGMRAFIDAGEPIVRSLEELFARLGLEDTRQV
jgi:hypothetical protein